MRRSRSALERHFSPDVSRQLDALIEGLTIHQALDTEPHDPRVTVSAIDAICGRG
jgi:TetR/AcrR family transcriptional regulator, regulator of biofilm formation and stress response